MLPAQNYIHQPMTAKLPYCILVKPDPKKIMMSILLIEDDVVDVMNVQRALKKGNIATPLYVASNGLEGLEMLRGTSTKSAAISPKRLLILLDINMPKMNGIEFLKTLRADPTLKTIPVVMLTTSNEQIDRFNAYSLNVAGYLLKPLAFSAFVEMMSTLYKYWTLCEMV
jgi:CheY-like chemotaxis protein